MTWDPATPTQDHFAELLQQEGGAKRWPKHQEQVVLSFFSFLSSPRAPLLFFLLPWSWPCCLNDPWASESSQGTEDSSPQYVWCWGSPCCPRSTCTRIIVNVGHHAVRGRAPHFVLVKWVDRVGHPHHKVFHALTKTHLMAP